ncbi:hypothetical protein EVAR_4835_1 [Eumeta japonica]|uniref:Uncharacterized protein n=1 Tax=Eumeta variegata TaxID=151549 RepID=A0A4C1SZ47_EUMVA|nr:hypothetical protein EVAR_4835_1 [Eumeta japonica]
MTTTYTERGKKCFRDRRGTPVTRTYDNNKGSLLCTARVRLRTEIVAESIEKILRQTGRDFVFSVITSANRHLALRYLCKSTKNGRVFGCLFYSIQIIWTPARNALPKRRARPSPARVCRHTYALYRIMPNRHTSDPRRLPARSRQLFICMFMPRLIVALVATTAAGTDGSARPRKEGADSLIRFSCKTHMSIRPSNRLSDRTSDAIQLSARRSDQKIDPTNETYPKQGISGGGILYQLPTSRVNHVDYPISRQYFRGCVAGVTRERALSSAGVAGAPPPARIGAGDVPLQLCRDRSLFFTKRHYHRRTQRSVGSRRFFPFTHLVNLNKESAKVQRIDTNATSPPRKATGPPPMSRIFLWHESKRPSRAGGGGSPTAAGALAAPAPSAPAARNISGRGRACPRTSRTAQAPQHRAACTDIYTRALHAQHPLLASRKSRPHAHTPSAASADCRLMTTVPSPSRSAPHCTVS